ncbi:hypothetical protein Brms1b_000759 [Colletotrichum noveboracense]|nr:hypothetical protein Brms1b_000759 [Colletotrichum noveboracense]
MEAPNTKPYKIPSDAVWFVNNAGYTLAGDAEGAGDEEASAVMDTNFWGMVDVTKKALGIMREENPKSGQQGGVILNISSIGGWAGFPSQAFYHASKFAMEGWTESVAKELPTAWNSELRAPFLSVSAVQVAMVN